jgi:hypothetical protein
VLLRGKHSLAVLTEGGIPFDELFAGWTLAVPARNLFDRRQEKQDNYWDSPEEQTQEEPTYRVTSLAGCDNRANRARDA